MLKTKSIKAKKCVDDGLRISIMSRHTLNDGITPDKDITEESYNQWWVELSPPPKLIGDYYRKCLSWDEFAEKFKEFLQTPEATVYITKLVELASADNVTILCVEDTSEHCHRRLVAERCLEIDNSLVIILE